VSVIVSCQYFKFLHSPEYQKVQIKFWESVETYNPNAIAAVLHAHPYHVDSLLQLSEVCKMGEDIQMAADLIERAVYHYESIFHPLFNYSSDTCRLRYKHAENRGFFLVIFRHLSYVGRKGCHKTAFELCKLLLSLDPDGDPLCVLLMIDYYAIRCCEYQFIIDLHDRWGVSQSSLCDNPASCSCVCHLRLKRIYLNYQIVRSLSLFLSSTNPIPLVLHQLLMIDYRSPSSCIHPYVGYHHLY
jgi:hypothetical protein